MISLRSAETERFRGWTARHFGLHFDDDKLTFLATLMAERAAKRGVSAEAYLQSIGEAPSSEERRLLIKELTVPETYFFRHVDQFKAFSEVALPQALARAGTSGQVRILCAGCATGEEPYSLAIWMRERGIDKSTIAPIRAVDLNPTVLQKAVSARYSPWALRETSPATRASWFASEGRDFVLDASIRAAVTFEELNLADTNTEWWSGNTFDVIFCRNVLMYFTREAAAQAIARLSGALAPGGYLFMGHAETLRGLSEAFELCHSHGAFYYRLGSGSLQSSPRPATLPGSWPSVVERSAERADAAPTKIARVPKKRVPSPGTPSKRSPELTLRVQEAWRLLTHEHFAAAVDALEPLPDVSHDPEARLMRAALLTHAGRLEDAELECISLLNLNSRDACAHYLLALCRDGVGDRCGATDHDREAMSLAPRFSLPPLHLGLMARRAGDAEEASRYLASARELLETEDAERLTLYGGGFSRSALVSLCGAPRPSGRRKAAR